MFTSRDGHDGHDGYDDASQYQPYYPPYDPWAQDTSHRGGAAAEPTHTPAPRGNRRPIVVALAALVALMLLPVAVDRVVAARIESRTAEAFQEGMDTPVPPRVQVRGFPVLTQAASGTLRRVDITAHDIPAQGADRPLPVTELSLQLDGLTKSDDDSEARARSAEATAHLSYAGLSDTLGLEISQGSRAGEVRAEVLLPFGKPATVTTTVAAATGNRITFKDFGVEGGRLPGVGSTLLDKVFAQPIQLRNIPDGLRLRSVTTTADGLAARFSGHSVTFRPEGGTRGNAAESDAGKGTA